MKPELTSTKKGVGQGLSLDIYRAMMSVQEPTPIPVGNQQLATCGQGPNIRHRGHLCKSRGLNASVPLPQSKQKEAFLSMDQQSPKVEIPTRNHMKLIISYSFGAFLKA